MRSLLSFVFVLVLSAPGAALAAALAPAAQPAPAVATDPFEAVLGEIKRDVARKARPLAVFDLDDTLFETAPRTRAILLEWLGSDSGKAYAAARPKLETMAIAYDLAPTLGVLGVPVTERQEVITFWAKRFFSSEYLKYDRPNPGAVAYTHRVMDAGATVVYLTGRPPVMRAGTEAALKTNGFAWSPADGRTLVRTKTAPRENDVLFKETAVLELQKQLGPVVLAIDNEPANVNMFHRVLPKAYTVYLDKPHSNNAPALADGVLPAADFPASR